MIDMSLQQSEPVALSHPSPGWQVRSVIGYSLLMALMIMLRVPVFVPAVVLYCGIRFGTRSAAVALFAATLISTVSVAFGGYPQDVTRFAYAFAIGAALTLGAPALGAIRFVKRGEPFGRVLMILLAASAAGMALTELLFRVVGGYSLYEMDVAQARLATVMIIKFYQANAMPPEAVQLAQRWFTYDSNTLVIANELTSIIINFTLSLLMVGRLPEGRQLAARNTTDTSVTTATGPYRLRNLSLPDGVLFLFILGGLAPLASGILHTIAANALVVAVFLYILQGFALLRFLLASQGIGFFGSLLAFIVGLPVAGLAGLFDPFFDFRHFKKRKDDSHESHSD
jgi:Predicted membrane protein (DUF2232)